MTMSDSLPKPLPSINALRAHLKLLERGVNDARDKRVGPRPLTPMPMQRAAAPVARPQAQSTNSFQLPAAPVFGLAFGLPLVPSVDRAAGN